MNSPIIMRSDDLRIHNRHRVLHTLREQGPLTRAQIGHQTGLSQAALSTLFGLMTEQGIVTSVNRSAAVQKRGRPRSTIALDPKAAVVVTVALTIDSFIFSLVNYAGVTLSHTEQHIDTRSLNETGLLQCIVTGVNAALQISRDTPLKAISIGFQGVTDASSGELLWSPIINIDNMPIAAMLKKRFDVPVSVNNDCGLIAKSLHTQEKHNLGDSFAAVLFAHGVGLGLYMGGHALTGASSSALELGHVQYEKDGALCRCGKRGCIEAYAATYGILRSAEQLSPLELPPGPIVDQCIEPLIDAAKQHSRPEKTAFEVAGKAIGFGLATLFTLLDPVPVALVGRSCRAIDLMRNEIEIALNSVGRSASDYSHLLHCYHEDTPLLLNGLVLEGVSIVDREFAEFADEACLESS